MAGEDRLTFLHGQSTADFLAMQPGRGCSTVSFRSYLGRKQMAVLFDYYQGIAERHGINCLGSCAELDVM